MRAPSSDSASTSNPARDADTVPGSPAPPLLDHDDRFRAFHAYCVESRAFLAERTWDNLAHFDRFAHAAVMAKAFLADYPLSHERRRVVHALHALLPQEGGSPRPPSMSAFVDDVGARAPDFRLHPGDLPKIAPSWSAFLADPSIASPGSSHSSSPSIASPGSSHSSSPSIVDAIFVKGARVLVPRGVCPAAAQPGASCIFVELGDVAPASLAPALGRATTLPTMLPAAAAAPVAYRARAFVDGAAVDVRIGSDQQPILAVDGKPQPIVVGADVVAAWLFSAGPDARGLDLRSADDRALLLAYAHELRRVDVGGRSAFAWLEDNGTPLERRVEVVSACINAAVHVVARHALDPLACRIRLRKDDGDGAWQVRAGALLDEVGLFHDVVSRASGPVYPGSSHSSSPSAAPGSSHSSSPSAAPGSQSPQPPRIERDIVWLDAFAPPSFAAGRASALAAGRMFARLATSMLAPLGVLPQSGMKDASGRVLLTRLVPRAAGGVGVEHRVIPDGAPDGVPLAEPKGCPRHDVSAMPAWLAFFLEGLSSSSGSRGHE